MQGRAHWWGLTSCCYLLCWQAIPRARPFVRVSCRKPATSMRGFLVDSQPEKGWRREVGHADVERMDQQVEEAPRTLHADIAKPIKDRLDELEGKVDELRQKLDQCAFSEAKWRSLADNAGNYVVSWPTVTEGLSLSTIMARRQLKKTSLARVSSISWIRGTPVWRERRWIMYSGREHRVPIRRRYFSKARTKLGWMFKPAP